MKKIVYSFLLCLIITKLNSQINIGIKAGVNISNLQLSSAGQPINQSSNAIGSPTSMPNNSTLTAPYFGVYSDFKLNQKLILRPEIIYSSEGGNEKLGIYDHPAGSINGTFLGFQNLPNHINLVQIPLTFKYNVVDNLNLLLGPQFGFVISHSSNTYPPKSSNIAMQFGSTYSFPMIPLEVEIKYNLGLSKIKNPPKTNINGYSYDNSEKLNVIQIGFGYKLKQNYLKK